MELYVNPTITGFRQDVDGTIRELKIGSNKEDAWANIAEQGASAKLDNNKTATIDVSAYTEPVEITPTSGKDGMKKATVTLSNIPSGSDTYNFYAWDYDDNSPLFTMSETPAVGDNLFFAPNDSDYGVLAGVPLIITEVGEGSVTVSDGDSPVTYTRASTKDLVFNKASS